LAKYVIVYAHPNPHSFNHAILTEIESALKRQGKDYLLRDLNALPFHPVLTAADLISLVQGRIPPEILAEQEFIARADTIIFVHPIWWFNMPAILKGYIDRVFSRGFAYDVVEGNPVGLLTDKKVMLFNTTGGSQENYLKFGYDIAIKTAIDQGVFEFCGMTIAMHKMFYAVPSVDMRRREAMLSEIRDIVFD